MYAWHLTVPTIYTYERYALVVNDGKVCQCSTYEGKESIGSNSLYMTGVQLSGRITTDLKKEEEYHRDSIPID